MAPYVTRVPEVGAATATLIELAGVEEVHRTGRLEYRALRGVDLSIATAGRCVGNSSWCDARGTPSGNANRVQPAKKIERQGIAVIGKVVADMGHLWNEPQNDFGTDGSIELVDPTTEKATNRIVLYRANATSVTFGDRPLGSRAMMTTCAAGFMATPRSS